MFKDYYKILEINESATQLEIKSAYKRLALRWHPDKNPGLDTNEKMKEINEAYLILKDPEARERYDREYSRFKNYLKSKEIIIRQKKEFTRNDKNAESSDFEDYNVHDEILNKWMNNARKQAYDMAKLTIEELLGMTSAGIAAAFKEMVKLLLVQIGCLLIFLLIFLIISIIKTLK